MKARIGFSNKANKYEQRKSYDSEWGVVCKNEEGRSVRIEVDCGFGRRKENIKGGRRRTPKKRKKKKKDE